MVNNMKSRILRLISSFVLFGSVLCSCFTSIDVLAEPEPSINQTSQENSSESINEETNNTSEDSANSIIVENEINSLLNEMPADAPIVSASSYLLFDTESNSYLLGNNIDTLCDPASTTKVLTCLIALEECDLEEIVTVTSSMYTPIEDGYVILGITEGEELRVVDLIYAALLESANDAALALAVHIGGTEQEFCNMMNAKAAEIGCENPCFTSAYGYGNCNNRVTASNMALIVEAAVSNPTFCEISTSSSYTISPTNKYGDVRTLTNANNVIATQEFSYDYYIGGKTGYNDTAGYTIVGAATKHDRTLVVVIFNATSSGIRYQDMINLFEFGFNRYTTVALDDSEFASIYTDTRNQIEALLQSTDLEISNFSMELSEYHTTLSSRSATGYVPSIDLSQVIIDPEAPSQNFSVPLCRTYTDGSRYVVGYLQLEISTKSKFIEITPEKNTIFDTLKVVLIVFIVISVMAIIIISLIFYYRSKHINRKIKDSNTYSKIK